MKSIFRSAGLLLKRLQRNSREPVRSSSEQDSLRLLAENCGDVIFRFGLDGRARYISPSVKRLLGCPPKEIYAMGGDVFKNGFLHEEDQDAVGRAVQSHFMGALPENKIEFRIRRRDGETIWVETNCSTIIDKDSGMPSDIIFTMREMTEKKVLQAQLEALARTDSLTGLANRRTFDETLDREWRRASREKGTLSLLVIDVDSFKNFNDAYGHQAGDDCLRTVAAAIAKHSGRAGDLAARYGGEEFAVILPQTNYDQALAAGERIRSAVEALGIPHANGQAGSVVTVSVGAASSMTASGGTIEMPHGLLQAADMAMYKSKAGGRNRVEGALLFSALDTSRTAA